MPDSIFTPLQSSLTFPTHGMNPTGLFCECNPRFCGRPLPILPAFAHFFRRIFGLPAFAGFQRFVASKNQFVAAKRSHGQGDETEWCRKRGNQSVTYPGPPTHPGSEASYLSDVIWIKGWFSATRQEQWPLFSVLSNLHNLELSILTFSELVVENSSTRFRLLQKSYQRPDQRQLIAQLDDLCIYHPSDREILSEAG